MIDLNKYNIDEVKYLFEKQKKEYTQSLQYASYIQNALLPTDDFLSKLFTEYFLVYIPLDIVSGDFYWVTKKCGRVYFAVADCTGHGVPGAFLSILGISYLNQIVDRFDDLPPASILNLLREYLMKALKQTGEENEQKDGIEMGLCILDFNMGMLEYAGAFNSLYLIRDKSRFIEIVGDKMPIGIAAVTETSFTNYKEELQRGDMIYLFSDGFVDQFGGPQGKKYKYRPFRSLLMDICSLPAARQKDALLNTFGDWKGSLPQLDDILIFGFRY